MRKNILFVLMLVFSGVVFSDSGSSSDTAQAELDRNIALWNASGVNSYDFTYRRLCFCLPEEDVVVSVVNKEIVKASYSPSGSPLSGNDLDRLLTVEDLFAVIQEAISNDVASIDVFYNANRGYPVKIYIDVDERMADEEITHILVDFHRTSGECDLQRTQ